MWPNCSALPSANLCSAGLGGSLNPAAAGSQLRGSVPPQLGAGMCPPAGGMARRAPGAAAVCAAANAIQSWWGTNIPSVSTYSIHSLCRSWLGKPWLQ